MFRPVSIAEEKQLENSIRICLMPPETNIPINPLEYTIYIYPGGNFSDGVTVFKCSHMLTRDHFILDDIELFDENAYEIDEREIYYIVPFLIRIAIKWALVADKDRVILRSRMPHFAEHLINNGFRIHKRVLGNDIIIKGIRTILN